MMPQNIFKAVIAICITAGCATMARGQGNVHQQSSGYEWPSDPLVREKLEKWRDEKFGMIIHWGLYAVPGIIESWELCSEDWIERDSTISYEQYKQWYWRLNKDFNPVKFDPEQWARAAKDAGMRYVVFTTKHHDGFNMFDTRQSDFKITNGPFANHPKSNVAKYVFEAFRNEGFMIGAYFSKPDWHSEYFWWKKYATPDRNVNYDIRKYKWRWNKFKEFTHNQISELVSDYGQIDILWLDGGWVRPIETVTDEVRAWGARIPPWSQHIDMSRVAEIARKSQPGILIVDRTVHGPYENYQTPEQRIPAQRLEVPWESCITLGGAWGYVPNDRFKTAGEVIHMLVEVVAKGGNLLLGVGPDAQGLLKDEQILRLREIGSWLSKNGDAIYKTRSVANFKSGNTFFTRGYDGKYYAISCFKKDEPVAGFITWNGNTPKKGSAIKLLGSDMKLKWEVEGDVTKVYLPGSVRKAAAPAIALSFSMEN
jgi:alpha-L-fucosidase